MRRFLSLLPSLAVTLWGLLVTVLWIVDQSLLSRFTIGSTFMVANAALCFLVAGGALLFSHNYPLLRHKGRLIAGCFLFVFSAIILLQDITGQASGIDQLLAHVAATDDNPNPGRMAPLTTICFMLCGLMLAMLNAKRRGWVNILFQIVVFVVLLLSIASIAAASMRLDLIYDWDQYARMALSTAINFLLLDAALWLCWYREEACEGGFLESQDKRIGVTGLVILALAALSAGLSGFGVLSQQMEKILEASLLSSFNSNSKLVENAVTTAIADAAPVTTRLLLNRSLIDFNNNPQNQQALANIHDDAATFIGPQFSALAIYDPAGKLVTQAGGFTEQPALRIPLSGAGQGSHAELLWKNGASLQVKLNIVAGDKIIGNAVVERKLTTLDSVLLSKNSLGESAETRICFARDQDNMQCLPSMRHPEIGPVVPRLASADVKSMDMALRGQSGLRVTRDYFKHQVITAYGPIGDLGLAMVVKIDTAEFYGGLRDRLHVMLVLLLLLGGGGFLLQRVQLMPLVARVVRSEERLKTIMSNIADGIVTVTEDGTFESGNKAFFDMVGLAEDRIIGWNITEILPVKDFATVTNLTDAAEKKARELNIYLPNGRVFTALLAVSKMLIGSQIFFVISLRDISQRKEIERMKEEFISTVSHELRTPLTSIRGSLGLLEVTFKKDLPDAAFSLVEIAHESAQRLIRIVNDILDIDKIAAGRMRFDMKQQALAPLMAQAIESNRAYANEYDVLLEAGKIDETLMIEVDGDRFMQVLSNLLSNAVKFSPAKGLVKVSVAVKDEVVRINVADDGPGISEEFRNRIFGKFSQADSSATREKSGTGLGLHITKHLVEQMNGRIGFDSEYGQGTVFWVEFKKVG